MEILCYAAQIYVFVLLARIILSWFPISPGGALASIFEILYTLTEPVLGPIRRIMPPVGVGGMGLDLSPIVVLFGMQLLVQPLLCS